jgi:hypothetical protein
MMEELCSTVENSYDVFHQYSLNEKLTVCRCSVCVDFETERLLIVTPLRQIPSGLLAQYTHSAHPWDCTLANDLRHFLPRYFELIGFGDFPCYTSPAVCLDRLGSANYRFDWPAIEADAVDRYFTALFRQRLQASISLAELDDPEDTEDILCMVARAGGNLAELLDVWDTLSSTTVLLRLARLIVAADWRKRRLRSPYWGLGSEGRGEGSMEETIRWLLRPHTRARLETAFFAERNSTATRLLSQAEAILRGVT